MARVVQYPQGRTLAPLGTALGAYGITEPGLNGEIRYTARIGGIYVEFTRTEMEMLTMEWQRLDREYSKTERWIIMAIGSHAEQFYWNNETGWGDLEGATRFTGDEKLANDLPIEGAWVLEQPVSLAENEKLNADRIDGFDRDDIGESPDL